MKQKDLTILAIAVFISILLSIVLSKYIFGSSKSLQQQVDVIPAISTSFPAPSSAYFNGQSIDPTQNTNIGPSNNSQPF